MKALCVRLAVERSEITFDAHRKSRKGLGRPSAVREHALIFAVWTRALDGQPMVGRLRVAHAIRRVMQAVGPVESAVLPSAFSPLTVFGMVQATMAWMSSLIAGRPLPLQCALYAASGELRSMVARIPDDAVVYLDGIRLYALARELRRARPKQRIIIDLDDLMSRRADLLLKGRLPLSTGHLAEKMPAAMRGLVQASLISRIILRYERATLRKLEREALEIADVAVLLSARDAETLRDKVPSGLGDRLVTIPPAVELLADPPPPFDKPARFIFIGTDGLTQNRLTIDFLLELWRRAGPALPLVLFGEQHRRLKLPVGVFASGYVESLADIYDRYSVLLTPSFIGGGIKTKVLEAFSHGVPVVGNLNTFESLTMTDYPLLMATEEQLVELIRNPSAQADTFRAAAEQGLTYVAEHHSYARFAERWREILRSTVRD